jgi:hypothetical protein
MTYTFEYIKEYWLGDGVVAYSPPQIIDSFNEVHTILGPDWLRRMKFSQNTELTGAMPTISVVELGMKLAVLRRGLNYNSLLDKLRSKLDNEIAKEMAEINAIYLLCNEADVEFELEPEVLRAGRDPSYPDFKLKKRESNEWVFVEVKQPDTSEHNLALREIIERIINRISIYENFLSVEIMLLELPSAEQLNEIERTCITLFEQNQITEAEIEHIGLIKVNHNSTVHYAPHDYPGFQGRPVLAQMKGISQFDELGNSTLLKQVVCRIGTSDERARRFLIDASDQLPPNYANLIWIDGRNVPSVGGWGTLIARQFIDRPLLNRKITGLVTYTNGLGLKEGINVVLNTARFTANRTADLVLPAWLERRVNSLH